MSFTTNAKRLLGLDFIDNKAGQACPVCKSDSSLKVSNDKYYKCHKCQSNGTIIDLLIATGYKKTVGEAFRCIGSDNNLYKDRLIDYQLAFDAYKQEFKHARCKAAEGYIKARGWVSEEFEVGLALNNTLRDAGLTGSTLVESYGEYFTNRLIFPIYNSAGKVIHLIGRAIDDSDLRWKASRGTPPITNFFYIPKRHHYNYLFICEGVSDALSLHQLGVPVIGQIGVNVNLAASAQLVDLVKQAKFVIFSYDYDKYAVGTDKAGEYKSWSSMMPAIIDLLSIVKKPAYHLPLPKLSGIKDINDWLLHIDYSAEAYLEYTTATIKPISDLTIEMYKEQPAKHNLIWKLLKATNDQKKAEVFLATIDKPFHEYLMWIN